MYLDPQERTYVIGDPHGMRLEFDEMIQRIEDDLGKYPALKARLVIAGDLIDRGYDSAGIVQTIVHLPNRWPSVEIIVIRGNHDTALIESVAGNLDIYRRWILPSTGGKETLRSYGVDPNISAEKAPEVLRNTIPTEHLDMFGNMLLSLDDGKRIFVHAGIRPGVRIDKQVEHDMLFIRGEFLYYRGPLDRFVIHGHSPRRNPEIRPYRLNVDTGAGYGLKLTCAILSGPTLKNIRFFSVPITHAPCIWRDAPVRHTIKHPKETAA